MISKKNYSCLPIIQAFILVLFAIPNAAAKIKIVTTTTNIAYAAREIGGSEVEVESLLSGTEDVHYVDASPSYIRKVANADIVCSVGLDLEIGWLPKVLAKSGNSKVQQGGKGFCELGKAVTTIEKPQSPIDRSMGDLHPFGNPHFDLSPQHFIEGASIIKDVLVNNDPAHAELYIKNYKNFSSRLQALQKNIAAKIAAAFRNKKQPLALEYHKEFSYFFHTYGIQSLGAIESIPGVPPSAGRIAEIALDAKQKHALLALGTPANPKKVLEKFQDLSGVRINVLPIYIQANEKNDSYEELQNKIANAIIESI